MTDKPFDTKKLTEGPLTFRIDWHYDPDADLSFLCEGTEKPDYDGVVYDRWTKWVWVHEQHRWWNAAGESLTWEEYDEKVGNEASGNRREYRYLHKFQHSGTAKSFDGCDPKQLEELIAKHGSLDAADRSYVYADAERLESYWRDQWYMTGCRVTLTVDGEELAAESLWGIESDSGDSYRKEVETDLISQAKSSALVELPKTIERLSKIRRKLKDLAPKALKS